MDAPDSSSKVRSKFHQLSGNFENLIYIRFLDFRIILTLLYLLWNDAIESFFEIGKVFLYAFWVCCYDFFLHLLMVRVGRVINDGVVDMMNSSGVDVMNSSRIEYASLVGNNNYASLVENNNKSYPVVGRMML